MTGTRAAHHRWSPSAHLGVLLEDIERLAHDVSNAIQLGSTAPQLWDLAVIASCRLDGSTMTATPPTGDIARVVVDDDDPVEVERREYAGVASALGADDLGALLPRDPLRALPALHRLVTSGLVATPSTGMLRRTDQVVSDGQEGRIVFHPVPPATIARELPALQELVADRDLHPVVTAGLLQFEVLRLHPFESANGRLARVAARLVLRDAGLDPGGLAVAEIPMSTRRLGNYDVTAAAMRSGDMTMWLETWAEDVVAGLRLTAAELGIEPAGRADATGAEPNEIVDTLTTRFTLVDLAEATNTFAATASSIDPDPVIARGTVADDPTVGTSGAHDRARRTAARLADAGLITIDSGTRGLRMTRGAPQPPLWSRRSSTEVGR